MPPSRISTILFDFGGVFSTNDELDRIGSALAKKYQVDPRTIHEITLRGWLKARIDPRYDSLFWKELAIALSISVTKLQKDYLVFPEPIPEMIAYARQLKRQGYQIAMLSNQIESWHSLLLRRWRLTKLFSPMVASYTAGFAKPDPRAYMFALKELGVPANRCLYIDDRAENLEPARKLGMETLLFTSPNKTIREIEKLLHRS